MCRQSSFLSAAITEKPASGLQNCVPSIPEKPVRSSINDTARTIFFIFLFALKINAAKVEASDFKSTTRLLCFFSKVVSRKNPCDISHTARIQTIYCDEFTPLSSVNMQKMFITILLSYKQYHKIILRICQNDFSQVTFSLPSIGNTVNCFLMI